MRGFSSSPFSITRSAFTLLEVMIAAAIMVTLVTSLLGAWSASMDFTYMVNQSLKRMESLETVRSSIARDFEQSAQFIEYDSAVMLAKVDAANENITLYPAILQGGREIRFVRFRTTSTAATTPMGEATYHENLLGANAQRLSQFATAPVSPYFIINPLAGMPGYWNLAPVWESDRTGLTFNQNADPQYLRLYRYVLVPWANTAPATLADATVWAASAYPAYPTVGPTIRRGMLLRQYRNAQSTTWTTLGMPLSDAVVFDVTNDENNAALPCFIFASAFDGVVRTGGESIPDHEVRLKMTFAQEAKNAAPVSYDVRLAFPFRRVDYGE